VDSFQVDGKIVARLFVAMPTAGGAMQEHSNQNLCLYSRNGERKYLKLAERHRALGVMARMERERA
jgi:hypothetical protein